MKTLLLKGVFESFLNGQHVCRHQEGVWNGIFSDQFGEKTYIRYGKAKGGLVGKTLSQEQVATWTLSHHLCNSFTLAYAMMHAEEPDEEYDPGTKTHKEGKRRKELDAADRNAIISEMKKYNNPLCINPDDELINIVTGRVALDSVNVDDALCIGSAMTAEFSAALPGGFYQPLKKKVITMEASERSIKVGGKNVYDKEMFYARMLVTSQKRDVYLQELFQFELSPVPSSLFGEFGDMRKGTKSFLLHKLATFASTPLSPVDVQLVDDNETLHHTPWPKFGTLGHFAEMFCLLIPGPHDTYVIFDKYLPGSMKSHERLRRAGGTVPRHHTLSKDMPLPSQDIIMKRDEDKDQLIKLFCDTNHGCPTLHIIGKEQSMFNHEEADANIVRYLLTLHEEKRHIQVGADDTDIFVLLVFFAWYNKVAIQISMKKRDGSIININATAEKLGDKCKCLLPLHSLTGCDSVSYLFGKGKATAVILFS